MIAIWLVARRILRGGQSGTIHLSWCPMCRIERESQSFTVLWSRVVCTPLVPDGSLRLCSTLFNRKLVISCVQDMKDIPLYLCHVWFSRYPFSGFSWENNVDFRGNIMWISKESKLCIDNGWALICFAPYSGII